MEGKTLPKGEDKKDLSLEKLEEVEKAYSDLMKAYSSCITALKLKKMVGHKTYFPKCLRSTEALLKGNILAPRFIKRNIRKQVDLLRGAFLLLITQNRNKIDPKIINRFELYYEDMNKLSTQFEKTGLIAIFYAAIPIIPMITGVAAVVVQIKPVSLEFSLGQLLIRVIIIAIIGYLFYFFILFLVLGFFGSRRLFREADVSEKEKKFLLLFRSAWNLYKKACTWMPRNLFRVWPVPRSLISQRVKSLLCCLPVSTNTRYLNLWQQIEKRAKVYVFVSITNDMLRNNNDES